MNENPEQIIFEDAMGFSGTVTASLSHEINNVLAIIGELSGLLGDYLLAVEGGRETSPEKRQRTTDKIAVQMERGKRHIQQLNRFAHSGDKSAVKFDAKENCEFTISLLDRFARLRKVRLETAFEEVTRPVEGSPFELQHVVFRAVELNILLANQQASVAISLTGEPAGIRLGFSCRDLEQRKTALDVMKQMSFLEEMVKTTNGKFHADYQPGEHVEIALELPYHFSFRVKDSDNRHRVTDSDHQR